MSIDKRTLANDYSDWHKLSKKIGERWIFGGLGYEMASWLVNSFAEVTLKDDCSKNDFILLKISL